MPQRFLRPGITNSPRWNAVSMAAQSLYIRLLTRVDDYGRHDGRKSVIWAQCFSVWNELNSDNEINVQECAALLHELIGEDLIEIYTVEDKSVLQIIQWQERVRENVKKWWPDKPLDINVQECAATLTASPPPPSSTPTPRSNDQTPKSFYFCASHHVGSVTADEIYRAYPIHVGKPTALKAIEKQMHEKCPQCLLEIVSEYAAFRKGTEHEAPSVPHPSTWFNQQRFNDDRSTWLTFAQQSKPAVKPQAQMTEKERITDLARRGMIAI